MNYKPKNCNKKKYHIQMERHLTPPLLKSLQLNITEPMKWAHLLFHTKRRGNRCTRLQHHLTSVRLNRRHYIVLATFFIALCKSIRYWGDKKPFLYQVTLIISTFHHFCGFFCTSFFVSELFVDKWTGDRWSYIWPPFALPAALALMSPLALVYPLPDVFLMAVGTFVFFKNFFV